MRTFQDLKVWQKGIELVKEVYRMVNNFPREELFGLTSQMKRAAISVPSNIAEGFKRRYAKEHKQFLSIALGSCAELETHLVIAKELGYVSENMIVTELLDHISRMIVNLDKKI
ncbi:MAG: four helix bundle protein [Candidatus Omnitrophica bacterium]|nr:four helix bundle protein [Candidatus Omnitrophota bacterium]